MAPLCLNESCHQKAPISLGINGLRGLFFLTQSSASITVERDTVWFDKDFKIAYNSLIIVFTLGK